MDKEQLFKVPLWAPSKQVSAFARDKGLPFHEWYATVGERWEIPVNGESSATFFLLFNG